MKLYQKMFGEAFDLGFNVDDYPFLTDRSYRNDICPSFYFKAAERYYILWVDYPTPADRDNGTYSRYTIVEAENLENETTAEIQVDHSSEVNIEMEDVTTMTSYLHQLRSHNMKL
ncbi:MAG: hypothetical protein ACI88H_000657 [Cocleimonas sp.]|jgi:hypothetical protein